jgi:hypothetical protein
MGVGGQRHAPAAFPPPPPPGKKTQYPLYRRLGGPQGRSGRVRKISSPSGFDPWTLQPVVSRYTDYAIPAHTHNVYYSKQITPTFKTASSPPCAMDSNSESSNP